MASTPLRPISTHQDAMKGLKQTSSLKRKPLATLSTNVLAQEEAERGTPVKKRKTEEWEDADIDNPTRRDEVNMAWLDMCCALLTKKRTDLPTNVIDPTDQLPELDLPCKGTPSKPRTISPVASQDEVDPRDVDVINAARTLHEQSQPSITCCGCKTGCLKLYCRCFLTRGFCTAQCSCATCLNTKTSAQRLPAIIMHLKNNINAFRASSHSTPQLPGGNTDHGSMGLGSMFVPMIPNVKYRCTTGFDINVGPCEWSYVPL
ncbi:hypothetical protein AC1031_015575 [Aphanomyces cochlioides]|nr:hypothetical protein AC1031_015575 [Aphanomyces cochlioides]